MIERGLNGLELIFFDCETLNVKQYYPVIAFLDFHNSFTNIRSIRLICVLYFFSTAH